jgi:phosphatidylglycerophosphate synthase
MEGDASKAVRTNRAITATAEKRVLARLAGALPAWVLPDHLTILAQLAALWIGAGYGLSNHSKLWLWSVNAALVVHWFGDSLDGTLARRRRIERPRYGFYVDHLSDAFAITAIGIGLGLSPYMLLAVGLAIVVAYLLLSINVYLETITRNEFRFGYGYVGPTEGRILLIALNTVALVAGPIPFEIAGVGATVFDAAGIVAAIGMTLMLVRRILRNLDVLGKAEPPNVVRDE